MSVSWMKKGAESAAVAKQEQVETEERKSQQGKMFRFFVKQNEEAAITFIDGELSPEGFLLPPRFYEHNLFLNGTWGHTYVCPQKTAPHLGSVCPICQADAQERPALVSLFTVIDHREFTSTKDSTKKYKDTRKLFVAKSGTMEILNKIAIKRGGLAGCTFDVNRTGEKSASVGTMFDFTQKRNLDELQALYQAETTDPKTNVKTKGTYFLPANYEEEIPFYTGEQLLQMGFGGGPLVSNHQQQGVKKEDPLDTTGTDYASQL